MVTISATTNLKTANAILTILKLDEMRAERELKRLRGKPGNGARHLAPKRTVDVVKQAQLAQGKWKTPTAPKKQLSKARPGTQVAKIRAMAKTGLKGSQIAKRLKLNPGTVWHALNG